MASPEPHPIMIASSLSISQPAYLSLAKGQLQISLKTSGEIETIPIDSLGYLILDHPQITLTHALLAKLGAYQVATVICDSKHLPISLTLPLYGHHLSQERFHQQLHAPAPLKKQLWKQIITQKIDHQSLLLKEKQEMITYHLLQQLKSEVRSGDSSQKEAQAAKHYWKALFGKAFFRDPKREDFYNLALNYGYAILRAIVARALIGSGLLPFAGIHHHNRYNPHCLADDIMEPYRPWVDRYLYHLQLPQRVAPTELSKAERTQLLEIPYLACHTKEGQSQLHIGIAQTTASLAKVYHTQNHRLITFPSLPCDEKKKRCNTKIDLAETMWLFVLFDIPRTTKKQCSYANQFRQRLLSRGFTMMQFSVYIRHCGTTPYRYRLILNRSMYSRPFPKTSLMGWKGRFSCFI